MRTVYRHLFRSVLPVSVLLGITACGPYYQEHCAGRCPPQDVGVYVDTGVIRKSIWVDGSEFGFNARRRSFCLINGSDDLVDYFVAEGEGRGLIIQVDRGAPAQVTPTVGDETTPVDLDADGRLEFIVNSYVSARTSPMHFYNEQGAEAWAGESLFADWWQTLNVIPDSNLELLVYTEQGLIILDAAGMVISRIGTGIYFAARVEELDGQPVVVTYTFGEPGQHLVQTWSIGGELLQEESTEAGPVPRNMRAGVVECAGEVYSLQESYRGFNVEVSHTTLTYSSAIGLLTGGLPRGTPEDRTIRTGIKITNNDGMVLFEEVLAGGNESHFGVVRASETDISFVLSDGTRLIRYRLPPE